MRQKMISEEKKIVLLNLMPMKEEAADDIRRVLSYSSVPFKLCLMKLRSHVPRHASQEYMNRYYRFFDEMRDERIDALIVNGAPVEILPFEDVDYWSELCEVFRWAHEHVGSSLFICWGAQAALYHLYDINKFRLPQKMFGVFKQKVLVHEHPVFNGFDSDFWMPHSRHTEIRREDIEANKHLQLLAEGEDGSVSVVASKDGKALFVTGHLEYSATRLDWEYRRDCERRSDVGLPVNYYQDDNPRFNPRFIWKEDSIRFFTNWFDCCVKRTVDEKT